MSPSSIDIVMADTPAPSSGGDRVPLVDVAAPAEEVAGGGGISTLDATTHTIRGNLGPGCRPGPPGASKRP